MSSPSADAERALLAERILAEQEERRRLGELLHDGPVQHLAAISQILDSALAALRDGQPERADEMVRAGSSSREARAATSGPSATTSSRACSARSGSRPRSARSPGVTARDTRSRSSSRSSTRTSSARTRRPRCTRSPARRLTSRCDAARRRSSRSRSSPVPGGGAELFVSDDGPPERRSAVLESLAERAATLNARFSSEVRYPRGSTIRVELPPSAASRCPHDIIAGHGRERATRLPRLRLVAGRLPARTALGRACRTWARRSRTASSGSA